MNTLNFDKENIIKSVSGIRKDGDLLELATDYFYCWREDENGSWKSYSSFNEMTEENFVKNGKEMILKAKTRYAEFTKKMSQLNLFNQVVDLMNKHETVLEKIKTEADKKYKKDFYKQKFITDTIESFDLSMLFKLGDSFNKNNDFSTLYFDKYFGSSNSTSVLTVQDNESIERSLKEIYECVKNHEMRSHFKYMRITFKEMSGRLEFNFKLDKEGEEIVKENDRKLTESIENFYKDTNYWGD